MKKPWIYFKMIFLYFLPCQIHERIFLILSEKLTMWVKYIEGQGPFKSAAPKTSHIHVFPHSVSRSSSKYHFGVPSVLDSATFLQHVSLDDSVSRLTDDSFHWTEFSDSSQISPHCSIFPVSVYRNDESEICKLFMVGAEIGTSNITTIYLAISVIYHSTPGFLY